MATAVFCLLRLLPGDPVLIILGSEGMIDLEVVEAVRERLGLHQPIWTQYVQWLSELAQLRLGTSLVDDYPVMAELAARFPRTMELMLAAMALAILCGLPAGIIAAMNRNRLADTLISAWSALGISLPVYIVGTLLVLLFGVQLRWLPTAGYVDWAEGAGEHLVKLILPSVTLALSIAATITRMTRSSILDVIGQDYVRTAYGKGLAERTIILRHVLRNGLIPIITVIGIQFGTLIGGAVLVEHIFNWPGLSTLLITAVRRRDYPMVQGVVLIASVLVVLIQMALDVVYAMVDPRIRYD